MDLDMATCPEYGDLVYSFYNHMNKIQSARGIYYIHGVASLFPFNNMEDYHGSSAERRERLVSGSLSFH